MGSLLEMLGKGLEKPFMELILPGARPLKAAEAQLLQEQLQRCPGHRANQLRLGIHYAQSGAEEKARRIFQEILKQEPGHMEARLAWAALHMSLGELGEAIEQLEKSYHRDPHDSRVTYGLGLCYERLGQSPAAQRYYREATRGHPYLRKARERRAAMCLRAQDYAGAAKQYLRLQEEHPEDVPVYLFLGQLHLLQQEYEQAEKAFERAITIEPDNFDLHDDQVEALLKEDRLDEAIERMEALTDHQGQFADNYHS